MNKAIFRISRELLESVLLLPRGSKIVDVSRDAFFDRDEFGIKVEGPDFPAAESGSPLPVVSPQYVQTNHGPRFVGWGESL